MLLGDAVRLVELYPANELYIQGLQVANGEVFDFFETPFCGEAEDGSPIFFSCFREITERATTGTVLVQPCLRPGFNE